MRIPTIEVNNHADKGKLTLSASKVQVFPAGTNVDTHLTASFAVCVCRFHNAGPPRLDVRRETDDVETVGEEVIGKFTSA